MHGSLVTAAGIDDRNEAVILDFHLFIADAELTQQFDSAHFKPDEVVGMVDDAHLVGLSIANTDAGFIDGWLRATITCGFLYGDGTGGGAHCSTAFLIVHCPVHKGLRFS